MKKLIVFGFAVVVAFAANAAAFQWTLNNVAKVGDASSVGAKAHLIDSSVVSRDAMIAALTANDTSKIAGAAILTETATIAQGTTGLSRINITQGTASSTVENYSAYTVILDAAPGSAKNFIVTQEIVNKANPGYIPPGSTEPGIGNVQFAFGTQASATWTAMAPEPTSGLLMLVGLGALALRRRRA